jgi:Ca2+-binding RTX toxin-like protein
MEVLTAPLVRRSRVVPAFGLLFILALLLAPPGARAAEVGIGYSILYIAGPGETNEVAVGYANGSVTFTESGAGITLTDADGPDAGSCDVAGNVATCPNSTGLYGVSVWADDGDDELSVGAGMPRVVSLHGEAGDDTLSGGDYGTYLFGEDGHDTMSGGSGNDYLSDGVGDDVVDGGAGMDSYWGDLGNDFVDLGPGDDWFNGVDYTGADTFIGGDGEDWIDYRRVRPITVDLDGVADDGEGCPGPDCEGDNAGADIENLSGGAADDDLTGNDLANVISGETGDDTIRGLGGDDDLLGDWASGSSPFGSGDDKIDGGEGNDWVFGDFGADTLTGGGGTDLLQGAAGNDVLDSADAGGRDADECGGGTDAVSGDAGDSVAGDCEKVTGVPAATPPDVAPSSADDRVVRRMRVVRKGKQVRITGVSSESGRVTIRVRKGGRLIGTGRKSVQAGRKFTLKIKTRVKVRRGRYMLMTTLRPANGRVWAASERVTLR